jgi:cell division protease FtsH
MSKALLEREVLDATEIQAIVEGRELPAKPKSGGGEDEVQKVLRPEPGRQPGIAPGPATA